MSRRLTGLLEPSPRSPSDRLHRVAGHDGSRRALASCSEWTPKGCSSASDTGRSGIRGGVRGGEGWLADLTALVGTVAIAGSPIVGVQLSPADDPAVGSKPFVHLSEIETDASGTEL